MEKAIILQAGTDLSRTQKDKMLAQGVGEYLTEIIKDDMIFGFSSGRNHVRNTRRADKLCGR